jgi:hypothetical protein
VSLFREVQVPLVDGTDFDVGGEIVSIGEHEAGKAFVFFKISGNKNEIGA